MMLYEKSSILRAKLYDYHEHVTITFTANCGKFGTDEIIDDFQMRTEDLYRLLKDHEDGEIEEYIQKIKAEKKSKACE